MILVKLIHYKYTTSCARKSSILKLQMAMSLAIEHTLLDIELIKSTKAKNKTYIKGFLYTLNGVSSAGKQYWLCEKR